MLPSLFRLNIHKFLITDRWIHYSHISDVHCVIGNTKSTQLNEHWTWQQTLIVCMSCTERRVRHEVKSLASKDQEVVEKQKLKYYELISIKKKIYDPWKSHSEFRVPFLIFCRFHLYKAELSTVEHTSDACCDMRNIGNLTAKFAFQWSDTDLCFSVLLNLFSQIAHSNERSCVD